MGRVLERAVVKLAQEILAARVADTPDWLIRPGRHECGNVWPLVSSIYSELAGHQLPETMRTVERRTVDAVLITTRSPPRILEFDEVQHFNCFRATTLRRYAGEIPLAFDPDLWIRRSEAKLNLEKGGFAAPKPPLFPGENGRHRQRAFRDALSDILPMTQGFAPTLRIADFEVKRWIHEPGARSRMEALLESRIR